MKYRVVAIIACVVFISVQARAQLVNPGFEAWDSVTVDKSAPASWETIGRTGMAQRSMFGTYRDSIPHEGKYALMVSRWYAYTWDMARQRVSISTRPTALHGYYRYVGNDLIAGPDTAIVTVAVTHWNMALKTRDTIGFGYAALTGSAEYIPFVAGVDYRSQETPDSLEVLISPTMSQSQCASGAWCSYLSVDDLSLLSSAAVATEHPTGHISVYPNPATTELNIDRSDSKRPASVLLTDILGNTFTLHPRPSGSGYDLTGLPRGSYLVTITEDGVVRYQSAIVKR